MDDNEPSRRQQPCSHVAKPRTDGINTSLRVTTLPEKEKANTVWKFFLGSKTRRDMIFTLYYSTLYSKNAQCSGPTRVWRRIGLITDVHTHAHSHGENACLAFVSHVTGVVRLFTLIVFGICK